MQNLFVAYRESKYKVDEPIDTKQRLPVRQQKKTNKVGHIKKKAVYNT